MESWKKLLLLHPHASSTVDKLEEVSADNITLDAKAKKAEMDKIKFETETSTLKSAVEEQFELVTNLVGMHCNVRGWE